MAVKKRKTQKTLEPRPGQMGLVRKRNDGQIELLAVVPCPICACDIRVHVLDEHMRWHLDTMAMQMLSFAGELPKPVRALLAKMGRKKGARR